MPLLASWDGLRRPGRAGAVARGLAAVTVIVLAVVLLAIGSRAGLVLGFGGLVGGVAVWWSTSRRDARQANRVRFALMAGLGAAIVALIVMSVLMGRATAFNRLFAASPLDDLRAQALPTILKVLIEYFPAGSGFGSFDPAFRQVEPDALLSPSILNQAHNDLLQIVLEGGLLGLLLLSGALVWLTRAFVRLWVARGSHPVLIYGRAACVSLVLIVAASAVDYPLRTPTMMAVTAALVFQFLALSEVRRHVEVRVP